MVCELVKNMISSILSMVAEEVHDQALLFLEFEEVVVVAVGFLVVLMYAFYVKWPYNKEI